MLYINIQFKMASEFNFEDLKTKYIELLDIIIQHSKNEEINYDKLKLFKDNLNQDDLELISDKFASTLEKSNKLKKLFLNRNERIFSQKNKVRLIPTVNLKTTIASLEEDKSKEIWDCIHLFYSIYRAKNSDHSDFINSIIEAMENLKTDAIAPANESKPQTKKEKVDNMLKDIAGSIKKNLASLSDKNRKGNPIKNLLKDAKKMTEKYSKEMKSGEISPADLLGSIENMRKEIESDVDFKPDMNEDELKEMVPGLFDTVNNMANQLKGDMEGTGGADFDFNKLQDIMPELEKILSATGLTGENKDGAPSESIDFMATFDKITSIFKNKKKDQKLTEDEEKEMEEFYSQLSTKDLEGLEQIKSAKDEKSEGDVISNVLSGLMSGDKDKGGLGNILGGMLGAGK